MFFGVFCPLTLCHVPIMLHRNLGNIPFWFLPSSSLLSPSSRDGCFIVNGHCVRQLSAVALGSSQVWILLSIQMWSTTEKKSQIFALSSSGWVNTQRKNWWCEFRFKVCMVCRSIISVYAVRLCDLWEYMRDCVYMDVCLSFFATVPQGEPALHRDLLHIPPLPSPDTSNDLTRCQSRFI